LNAVKAGQSDGCCASNLVQKKSFSRDMKEQYWYKKSKSPKVKKLQQNN